MWTHKQFTFRWCLLFVSNKYKHNLINKHTNKQTNIYNTTQIFLFTCKIMKDLT